MSRLYVFLGWTLTRLLIAQSESNVIPDRTRLKPMKIIDGETADIREFPYVVSLQYNGTFYGHSYDHFCCGSILNEKWIITSAQCAQARPANDYHVRIGSSKYYANGTVIKVAAVVIHPNFNQVTFDHDVGLIMVSERMKFNEAAQPIKLPEKAEVILENTVFSIAGWGATKLLGKVSDNLRKSHIEKMSETDCESIYGSGEITERMFCAYTEGFGPCVGDSGSPAVFDNSLIGIASWSQGCAYSYPTVYARLSSVRDWIEEVAFPRESS